MENPNNGDSGAPRGPQNPYNNPAWSSSGNRARANGERPEGLIQTRREDPFAQAQIKRVLPLYEPPLYARMRGFDRERSLATVGSMAGSFTHTLGRRFTDTEMQAFAEHLLDGVNRGVAYKWGITVLASIMTLRGVKTFRFPFFTPQTSGPLSPFTGPPPVRAMWHMARFGAYYMACRFSLVPFAEVSNGITCLGSMKKDPRLADVMRENAALGDHSFGNPNDPWSASPTSHRRPPPSPHDITEQTSYGEDDSVAVQAQAAWSAPRQAQPSQDAGLPERSDKWDTFPDDIDDASPVAPSAGNSPDDFQDGVSAWDRIRQQSQSRPKQGTQRPQQSWQAPQGMGASDEDKSLQYRGPQDSYSFSNADEEKALAKGQAQKEFDEMLERERRGVQDEPRPWGKR